MHLINCGNCFAFKIARDLATKGRKEMLTRKMARDEAPPQARAGTLMRLLAKLSPEDFAEAWPIVQKLFAPAGAEAEDNGEGFASPHEREVEPMDDKRNASPALDESAPFSGRPNPGGKLDPLAGDARLAYDAAMKVKPDTYRTGTTRVAAAGIKIDHAAVLAMLDTAR